MCMHLVTVTLSWCQCECRGLRRMGQQQFMSYCFIRIVQGRSAGSGKLGYAVKLSFLLMRAAAMA